MSPGQIAVQGTRPTPQAAANRHSRAGDLRRSIVAARRMRRLRR